MWAARRLASRGIVVDILTVNSPVYQIEELLLSKYY